MAFLCSFCSGLSETGQAYKQVRGVTISNAITRLLEVTTAHDSAAVRCPSRNGVQASIQDLYRRLDSDGSEQLILCAGEEALGTS